VISRTSCWLVLALGLLAKFALASFPGPALPQAQDLKGEALDEHNAPISGAVCTLNGPLLPPEGLFTTTEAKGQFRYSGLLPGSYRLTCAAEGFQPIVKDDLAVTDEPPPFVQLVLPRDVILRQKIEVREKAAALDVEQAAPPTTRLSSPHILALPLVEQKFKAALPVVPGVVRTPNGEINIKGVAESQSLLTVDSAETADPVTGSFYISLPLEAIQSLDVYKSVFSAEYGGFSGGVTDIQTRPPSSRLHFEAQAITPNPRIKAGHLVGIADFNPRIYFSAPLVKDRLSFSEAFEYDIDKLPVRGLAWPKNEIKVQGLNSFTSFQYIFSPQHLLATKVNIFPQRKQYANINSLVPQPASSDLNQRGFTVEVTDRYLLRSGAVLTTLVQTMKFDSDARGQGPQPMQITPDGWGGNFFNAFKRYSNQTEVLETYKVAPKEWRGKHELTLGGRFAYRTYTGVSTSHPVLMLREDGTLAERVDFAGAGSLASHNAEAALFAQDHWVATEGLALDAGLRYSGQSLGQWVNLAPRLGLSYSPGKSGRTILRAGMGVFNDRVPLLAGDFPSNPVRTVSLFDPLGALVEPPLTFPNEYRILDENDHVVITSSRHLNSTPFNTTWRLEADRELRPHMLLRFSYLSSRTTSQFIVDPRIHTETGPALVLSNAGASRYQEFESTFHARPTDSSEFNISYVYSHARGDLNTVGQIYVPFEQPVIRPNFTANLPSDIPHRLVTWGRFNTPLWGIFAGPLLDWHSGFPYSDIDVLQNYVGVPNSHRLPRFFSLDLKLGRDFHLPLPLLRNHVLRGTLTILNVTNNSNPRDVYSNIASPNFSHLAGFQHLFYETALDVLY
jgi:hypothetical protein